MQNLNIKNLNIKKLFNIIIFFILFLTTNNFVFSQGGGGTTGGTYGDGVQNLTLTNPLSCNNVQCVVQKIIDGIFTLAIPITVLMVLVGAFQILTAGGQKEKFEEGKKTITWAVFGFALIILSRGLISIIVDILGAK